MLRFRGDSQNDLIRPFSVRVEPDPSLGCRSGPVCVQNKIGPKETRRRQHMDGSARRRRSAWQILVGSLFCGTFCAEDAARAQTSAPGKGQSQARSQARKAGGTVQSDTDRRGAGALGGQVQDPVRGQIQPRNEPSAAYRESLRRTVEKRRQRRARRGQQPEQGSAPGAIGAIVPWPMPPALIIRQTPDVHGEVGSFLGGLRR